MNYIIYPSHLKIKLPSKGYFSRGDNGEEIGIIASFLAFNFAGYENKIGVSIDSMLGCYFGTNLEKWVKFFQETNNLEVDGCIGNITLNKMKEYGLYLWEQEKN